MRFTRYYKGEFSDTALKRSALKRRQAKAVAAYPLFAAETAASLPTADAVMTQRAQEFASDLARDRLHAAQKWLQGRAALRQKPTDVQRELLAYWQRCGWPGTPVYFLSMLHMHDHGRLPGFSNEAKEKAPLALVVRYREAMKLKAETELFA